MSIFPILYFKPTIVIIDDDEELLQTLEMLFENKYNVKTFSHPVAAKNYLDTVHSILEKSQLLNFFNENERSDHRSHSIVEFNLAKVQEIMMNPNRGDEVALVIADYSMPEMNGIELCSHFQGQPFRKLLLTGTPDYQKAVEALNTKVIDYFENKSAEDIYLTLQSNVHNLVFKYFTDVTNYVTKHLQAGNTLATSDQELVKFLQNIISEKHIIEYYLIDKFGSYLLIAENGQHFIFTVHNDATLLDFIQIIEDDPKSSSFIEQIRNKQKVPFFGIGQDVSDIDLLNHNSFLYTPTVINGKENYYVAVLDA